MGIETIPTDGGITRLNHRDTLRYWMDVGWNAGHGLVDWAGAATLIAANGREIRIDPHLRQGVCWKTKWLGECLQNWAGSAATGGVTGASVGVVA